MSLVLNIGAGMAPNPAMKLDDEIEWVRLDGDAENQPDIVHDIRNPIPTELVEHFDGAIMSHCLEHIGWRTVLYTLNNVVQCVKPGGFFILVVPDLEWACEQVLKGINDFSVMGVFYGGQKDEWDFHRCGFTRQGAIVGLQRCGLTVTNVEIGDYIAIINDVRYVPKEIRVWARKPVK